MSEPVKLEVEIGDKARTFAVGDFLNAIDQVVCGFQSRREITNCDIAHALRVYAYRIDDN